MRKLIILFVVAACCLAQDEESIGSSQVAVDERLPFFFYTVTLIVTTTLSTWTTTTLTLASTCTSLSSTTACSGKRRRRGILESDEEYFQDKIIQPSVVNQVQPTEAPVVNMEAERHPRAAYYHFDDFFYPFLLPTFNLRLPSKPYYNPTYRNRAPNFGFGSAVASVHQPEERFLFRVSTSTTTTFTTIFTTTVFSATITQVLLCSLPTNFTACPAAVPAG